MNWISLYWKSLNYTLVFIQYENCNLQCKPPILCIVSWNIVCIHMYPQSFVMLVSSFIVRFIVFNVKNVVSTNNCKMFSVVSEQTLR